MISANDAVFEMLLRSTVGEQAHREVSVKGEVIGRLEKLREQDKKVDLAIIADTSSEPHESVQTAHNIKDRALAEYVVFVGASKADLSQVDKGVLDEFQIPIFDAVNVVGPLQGLVQYVTTDPRREVVK